MTTAAEVLNGTRRWSAEAADCLEWLGQLPADCADLVCFSPPYEKARLYGDVKFKLSGQAWVAWMVQVFTACQRVCKGPVVCVCAGQTRKYRWSATPALLMADLHRAGFNLRPPCFFHRVGIPGSGGPDWFRQDHEIIICTSRRGRLPWADNTACGAPCRYAPGGAMSHRMRGGKRVNGKMVYDITTTDGYKDGKLLVKKGKYSPPPLANPGNAIQYTPSECEAIWFLRSYGNATSRNADEIVQDVQSAIQKKTLLVWCMGAAEAIHAKEVLLSALHGYSVGEVASNKANNRSGEISGSPPFQGDQLPPVWAASKSCASPQRRKSTQQQAWQCRNSLPSLPCGSSSSQEESAMSDLWQEESFVRAVRSALPQIQEAWRSIEKVLKQQVGNCCYSSNVISCSVGGGRMGHRLSHRNEAPFPLGIPERFIRSFCPPDGIVLDPFLGSGTTLHASILWGRRFIGCDLRQGQADIAIRRAESVTPMLEGMR